MKWSWRFARVFGIDIKAHATFVLALIWGAFLWDGGGLLGALYGVILMLILFLMVVLHELGHAVAAQRYGIPVHDIVLLPIGGVARLDRMPDKPSQELVVALAGPAVNLAVSLLALPVLLIGLGAEMARGDGFLWPLLTTPGWLNFVAFVFSINLSLLIFNMLPAFPMDGGRVLRALLAMRLPYLKATKVAVGVGQVFAVAFGAVGIATGNIFLAFVALFVFFGAGAEGQEVGRQERYLESWQAMPPILLADTPAYMAFDRLNRSPQQVLAVVDESGVFVGLVTQDGMRARWAAGIRGPVGLFVEESMSLPAHLAPVKVRS